MQYSQRLEWAFYNQCVLKYFLERSSIHPGKSCANFFGIHQCSLGLSVISSLIASTSQKWIYFVAQRYPLPTLYWGMGIVIVCSRRDSEEVVFS